MQVGTACGGASESLPDLLAVRRAAARHYYSIGGIIGAINWPAKWF